MEVLPVLPPRVMKILFVWMSVPIPFLVLVLAEMFLHSIFSHILKGKYRKIPLIRPGLIYGQSTNFMGLYSRGGLILGR